MSGAGGSRRWVTAFVEVIEPTETSRAQAVANALVQLGANYDPILVQKDPELFQSLMSVWQVGRDDFIRPLPTPAAQDSSSAKNLLAVLVLSGAAWLALCAAALCCLFSYGAVRNLRRRWCRRHDGLSINSDATLLKKTNPVTKEAARSAWLVERQEQKERLRTTFRERRRNNFTWNCSTSAPSEPCVPDPKFGAVLPGEHGCIPSPGHQLRLMHGLEQPGEGDGESLPAAIFINNYMSLSPEFVEETSLARSFSVDNTADARCVMPEASGSAADAYRVVPEPSGNAADAHLVVPEASGTIPKSPSSTVPRSPLHTFQKSPSSSIDEPDEHGLHSSLKNLASRLPILVHVPSMEEGEEEQEQNNKRPNSAPVKVKHVREPPRPPLSAPSSCVRETQSEAKTESESKSNPVSVENDKQVVRRRIHRSNSWVVRPPVEAPPAYPQCLQRTKSCEVELQAGHEVELMACRTPSPQPHASGALVDRSLQPVRRRCTRSSEGGTLSGAGEQIAQSPMPLRTFLARARKSEEVFRMAPNLPQKDLSKMLKELNKEERHS